jgi:membrane-associated phospholipid phosphatase
MASRMYSTRYEHRMAAPREDRSLSMRGAEDPALPPRVTIPPALGVVTLGALVLAYVGALWIQAALYVPKEPVVAAFLLVVTAFRRLRPFLRDWGVLLVLLFVMDALREAAYYVTLALDRPVIVQGPIAFDRALFGVVPTVALQRWLHPTAALHWYDLPLAVLHGSHFLTFLVVGLVVWVWRPAAFRGYAAAVLLTSYAGLVGYFLVPTAPPWMASLQGALPPVTRVLHTVEILHVPRFLVLGLDTNPVAAMPSLHAAFSMTIVLGLGFVSRQAAWIATVYPITVALALVYGAEHYVADLLAGYALGLAGFWAGLRLSPAGARHSVPAGTASAWRRRGVPPVPEPDRSPARPAADVATRAPDR